LEKWVRFRAFSIWLLKFNECRAGAEIIGGMPVKSADAIVQLAEEEAADLIVLGRHGQSAWSRIFIGPVAEKVVGLSFCRR
jgi:K+-sensing histidine kinase KdpD